MKMLRWFAPALVLLLVLGWSAIARAQNPLGSDPTTASYLDNQAHTIPGGAGLWYRFNYGGGNSLITVTLVNGAGSNLRFNVFTPDQMMDWANATPIGRGTVLTLNCNSGLPAPGGGCQGNDLIWEGKFHTGGTYYIQLLNDNPQPVTFTLTVAGDDVAQCVPAGQATAANSGAPLCSPPAASPGQNQTATPAATRILTGTVTTTSATRVLTSTITSTPVPSQGQTAIPGDIHAPNTFYTDPYHALPLSGQMQTIPGSASIWYRFEYAGDDSNIVLRLENGAVNGLEFTLYLPEQAPSWYNETPIGRGTSTTCTQVSESSACGQNVNALLWSGKFPTGGTYFVQVTNPNPNPVQFVLTVTGTGVSVCTPTQAQTTAQGPNFFPCPTTGQTQNPAATGIPGSSATPRPNATPTPSG